jgi:hypothetical protein
LSVAILSKQLADAWEGKGYAMDAMEVIELPRPMGGVGLCVNCRILNENGLEINWESIANLIRIALLVLIHGMHSKGYTSVQFCIANGTRGYPEQTGIRAVRVFLESEKLREIESNCRLVSESALDSLTTAIEVR